MNTNAITFIESQLANRETTIAKDVKLNLKKVFEGELLNPEETNLLTLAIGQSLNDRELVNFASEQLAQSGFSDEQITEAKESAGIMGMLNTYYKFRTFLSNNLSSEEMEPYKTARLRMTSLARPLLGKDKFEMLAFGVSVINGCESCVVSHEKALRDVGFDSNKIHDIARLAANLKALTVLKY